MTVRELIELLTRLNPNATVVADVDLTHCHSDRNVLRINGVFSDEDYTYIDTGTHV